MAVSISVVIPCYNAEPWIGEALASVESQGIEDLEVIVVDDGSTDGSCDLVRQKFPRVRLISAPHRGPSAARNLGTRLAAGEFIQYLDADDLLAEGKLRRQVDALEASGADVAYGDWQRLVEGLDGKYQPGEVVARQIAGPAEIALFTDFWCPLAAYLFRRRIIEKVGGFNERLLVIQDARFVLDCALYGARFVYTPGVVAAYRVHSTGSVSTRDPIAFVRDCFRNALEVEAWWQEHGGVTPERAKALVQVYGYVARASFELDRPTFEAALEAIRRWEPRYVPARPRHLALAARMLGYRRAEHVAFWYRRAKRWAAKVRGVLAGFVTVCRMRGSSSV